MGFQHSAEGVQQAAILHPKPCVKRGEPCAKPMDGLGCDLRPLSPPRHKG